MNDLPKRPVNERQNTFARLQQEVAAEKAVGTEEKRDLAGDGEYVAPTPAAHSAKIENPLVGISLDRLEAMGRMFAREKGLEQHEVEFAKGAQVAQDPEAFEALDLLNDEDKAALRRESLNKWDHPKTLYFLVVCCSAAACVQGMDESVTNGANLFWAPQFGLDTSEAAADPGKNEWLLGLVAGAPYLCCAVLGCWLTSPVNRLVGRRYAMLLSSAISFIGCIWSAVTNSWQHLLGARLFLGLGIGLGSGTVPVFVAEVAPPRIRGGLGMQWQVWTAFGIMLGTVSSLAFFQVQDVVGITGLNWRLMLGSALLPSILVMGGAPFCPESPRWLIKKGRYVDAFHSLTRLRHTKLEAARDLFMINALLEEEASLASGRPALIELFSVARNRRAAVASGALMFMQQFCGINVIAYYSSTIFRNAGFDEITALGATLGFGALNWLFAAPAFFTIDTFGRRQLLLTTFPLMACFLLLTGFAFYIPTESKARIAVIALGIYLHCMAYSPGMGPVPFTYSAEAFPASVRDVGMSYATALTWCFNFVIALTFPRILRAFTPQGTFGFYAAWNVIGAILTLTLVPETKGLTLEELDMVFSVPSGRHARYHVAGAFYNFRKYVLRQELAPRPPLFAWDVKA
ncbi:hypothetical protein JCM10212_001950 [Sporobolomyces blumeae]